MFALFLETTAFLPTLQRDGAASKRFQAPRPAVLGGLQTSAAAAAAALASPLTPAMAIDAIAGDTTAPASSSLLDTSSAVLLAEGSIVDTLITGVFGLACLGLIGFIASYAFEAAKEVGSQTSNLEQRLADAGVTKSDAPKSNEPLYDNSLAEDLAKQREPVKKRSKTQLVTDEELARMAPWMAAKIDQEAIRKAKNARLERKKREAGGR